MRPSLELGQPGGADDNPSESVKPLPNEIGVDDDRPAAGRAANDMPSAAVRLVFPSPAPALVTTRD